MGIDCKVCNSDKRDFIESLILQGHSNLAVSATVKDMGEDISHASINRHKTKHMADYAETIKEVAHEKGNRKYDREDSQTGFSIDASVIYDEAKTQALHSLTYDELAGNNKTVTVLLNRILTNQLAITISMQEKYMKGEAKYPNEQVRGLQIIQEINQKFVDSARKTFSHLKSIVYNKEGILDHIKECGKNAKKELELKTPYVKGTIFLIAKKDEDIEEYYEIYYPVCPYGDDFNGKREVQAFQNGIMLGMTKEERLDVLICDMLVNNWGQGRPLEKIGIKLLNRYIKNEYDGDIEFNRLVRLIDKSLDKECLEENEE
jgi:hypothetical protein